MNDYQSSFITHQSKLKPYKCNHGFAFVMKFTDKLVQGSMFKIQGYPTLNFKPET